MWAEAFYRMLKLIFVQKLLQFEFRDFGRVSFKKTDKIGILRYFTPNVSPPSIYVQITWNLHQISTSYRETKLRELFFGILKIGDFKQLKHEKRLQFRHMQVIFRLTVNSICSFWQWTGIWGVWYHPPKILETTERMTLKFLPDVNYNEEARNLKFCVKDVSKYWT